MPLPILGAIIGSAIATGGSIAQSAIAGGGGMSENDKKDHDARLQEAFKARWDSVRAQLDAKTLALNDAIYYLNRLVQDLENLNKSMYRPQSLENPIQTVFAPALINDLDYYVQKKQQTEGGIFDSILGSTNSLSSAGGQVSPTITTAQKYLPIILLLTVIGAGAYAVTRKT